MGSLTSTEIRSALSSERGRNDGGTEAVRTQRHPQAESVSSGGQSGAGMEEVGGGRVARCVCLHPRSHFEKHIAAAAALPVVGAAGKGRASSPSTRLLALGTLALHDARSRPIPAVARGAGEADPRVCM